MKRIALFLFAAAAALGQAGRTAPPFTRQFLPPKQYSADDDARTVKLYQGLRVCDVVGALDAVGLQDITVMDRNIRPLWRDEQKFSHRIWGIAITVRLMPAQEAAPRFAFHAEERAWEGRWYNAKNNSDFGGLVKPGNVLVVDNQAHDDGFCGSNMGLGLLGQGLRGLVGNEVCRDSGEMILSRIPVYQDNARAPRGINPGRMWTESYNQPVAVGHVLVMLPGDVIVGDSDGIAVVPRAQAEQVAKIARWIFEDDEIVRCKIFDRIDKPRDWTVQGHTPPGPAGLCTIALKWFRIEMMQRFDRITWNPNQMNGQPCIRGMRLTVRRVVEGVALYPNRDDLFRNYPELEPDDVLQALAFAAANLEDSAAEGNAA